METQRRWVLLSLTLVSLTAGLLVTAVTSDAKEPPPPGHPGVEGVHVLGGKSGTDAGSRAPTTGRADWWDPDWNSRMQLTFDNSGQSETLSDLPVLVELSSANFDRAKAEPDGADLRFIDEDGTTELAYEIESWDEDGASCIWVNVTSIDGGSTTDHIWLYYNNPAADPADDPNGVWDSAYVMVQHLDETTGVHFDSTSHGNDGANNGAVQDSAGVIDGADRFDTNTDDINCGSDASLKPADAITVSAWVKSVDATTRWESVGGLARNDNWKDGYGIFFNNADTIRFYVGDYEANFAGSAIAPADWNHVVGTYDRNAGSDQVKIYVNGVLGGTTDTYSNAIDYNGGSLTIAELGGWTDDWLNGFVDEFRISANVARSADYIAAQYLSMTGDLITYGSEDNLVVPELDSIRVTPGSVDVPVSKEMTFTAQGYDQYGAEYTLTDTEWNTNAGVISKESETEATLTAGDQPLAGGSVSVSQGDVTGFAVVNVVKTYDDPVIAGTIPDQRVDEDCDPWVLNLTDHASDAQDGPSGLRWYVQGVDPGLLHVAGQEVWGNHELTFTPVPDAYGTDMLTLTLEDSDRARDSQDIKVTVTPANDAPVIVDLPQLIDMEEDQSPMELDLSKYKDDVDSPEKDLNWEIMGEDTKIFTSVQLTGDTLRLTPAPDAWGHDVMTLVLSDGALQDTAFLNIDVAPVNDPPVLIPVPEQVGRVNESWALNLSDHCQDIDDEFETLVFETDSAEVVPQDGRLLFSGSPDTPAVVRLSVSDGELSASLEISVRIASEGGSGTGGGTGGTGTVEPQDADQPAGDVGDGASEKAKDFSFSMVVSILLVSYIIIAYAYSSVYHVEEVYVIHRKKGSVILHMSVSDGETLDKEAIGGMLPVFNSFVKDAFAKKGDRAPKKDGKPPSEREKPLSEDGGANEKSGKADKPDLTEFSIGGKRKVMVEMGEHLYLALIYRGSGSWLKPKVKRIIAREESQYGEALEDWDGDMDRLEGSEVVVARLLPRKKAKEPGRHSALTGRNAKTSGSSAKAPAGLDSSDLSELFDQLPSGPGDERKMRARKGSSASSEKKAVAGGTGSPSLLSKLAAMGGDSGGGEDGPPNDSGDSTPGKTGSGSGKALPRARKASPTAATPPKAAMAADGSRQDGGSSPPPGEDIRPGVRRLEPSRETESLKDH